MSIVLPDVVGARVLDLFAGSGALGLEALSRGAAEAHFVDSSPAALRVLKENINLLAAGEAATVHRADALRFIGGLSAGEFDVAFADPPYTGAMARAVAQRWVVTPFAHVLGIEHAATEVMPEGGETRRYGDSAVTFYRRSQLNGRMG
jgi:16S rRNA (guanine966-N2)-methyltransferase